MSKILVKTNLVHRFGRSVNFGFAIVSFNSEGIGEVDSQFKDSLLESDLEISTEESLVQKSDLDKLKKDELIQLAQKAELPEAEYLSLNKEDLIKYLLEKLA